jgi:hypothetical protein
MLAKLAPDGSVLWLRSIPGSSFRGRSMGVDASGDVTLFGSTKTPVDMGTGPLTSGAGVILARFSGSDGALVWARGTSLILDDHRYWSAAVSANGEVVVTGPLVGTADFGGGPLSAFGQGRDAFVAAYGADGSHRWSKLFGGNESQTGTGAAPLPDGSTALVGSFRGTVDFGGGPVAADELDSYVVVLDRDGEHVWSRGLGGPGWQNALAVACDGLGNIVLHGSHNGSVDLGGGPHTSNLANHFCYAGLLSSTGEHMWTLAFGCYSSDGASFGPLVAGRPDGGMVAMGSFLGVVDVGAGPMHSLGGSDALAFAVDAQGTTLWSTSFSSEGDDLGFGVAVAPDGDVLLTGSANGPMDLGAGIVSPIDNDAFLVRILP